MYEEDAVAAEGWEIGCFRSRADAWLLQSARASARRAKAQPETLEAALEAIITVVSTSHAPKVCTSLMKAYYSVPR